MPLEELPTDTGGRGTRRRRTEKLETCRWERSGGKEAGGGRVWS